MRNANFLLIAAFLAFTVIGDAQAQGAIPFDEALARIVQRSIGVQTQQSHESATVAGDLPTRLSLLPTLALDAGYVNPGTLTGATPVSTTFLGLNQKQAEFNARWNLFHFGADWYAIRAAGLQEDSEKSLVSNEVIRAEDSGVQALVSLIQARMELDVLAQLVDLQTRSLGIARERYQRGFMPQQEVDMVNIDLENARARLSDTQIEASQAGAQLVALLGSDDVAIGWPWRESLLREDPSAKAGEPDLSLRPDWKAAQSSLDAADAAWTSKFRQMLPTIDAAVAGGYYSTQPSTSWTSGWSGSILLNIPLFDHLTNYSNMRVQAETVRQAELSLENVRRSAKSEWDSALASFRTSLASAKAREQVVGRSRSIYQDQVRRFQLGKITVNDLAQDQTRYLDSELFAIRGWSAAHLNLSKLEHARGASLTSPSR